MLFIIIIILILLPVQWTTQGYACILGVKNSSPSLSFPQIGAQWPPPAKPNLTLPSCFTESTCCQKTLHPGGRNSFLQSYAGRQAGSKQASKQSDEDEAMVMVAASITPTNVCGRTLRDSEWLSVESGLFQPKSGLHGDRWNEDPRCACCIWKAEILKTNQKGLNSTNSGGLSLSLLSSARRSSKLFFFLSILHCNTL